MNMKSIISSEVEKHHDQIMEIATNIAELRIAITSDLLKDAQAGPICTTKTQSYDELAGIVERSLLRNVIFTFKEANKDIQNKEH